MKSVIRVLWFLGTEINQGWPNRITTRHPRFSDLPFLFFPNLTKFSAMALFSDEVAFYVQWPEPVEQIRIRNVWSIWTKVSGHQARLFFPLSSMMFQAQLKNMQHMIYPIFLFVTDVFFWSSYTFFISFASA